MITVICIGIIRAILGTLIEKFNARPQLIKVRSNYTRGKI
jgi:hypothetical protein